MVIPHQRLLRQRPHMPRNPKKLRVGSIDFTPATFSGATRAIGEVIQKTNDAEKGTSIHFANAYNIALAENDARYYNTINVGDLVFTDGVLVVWVAQRLHPQYNWERMYGPDVTEWILSSPELSETAKRYFLGATQETMEKLLDSETADQQRVNQLTTIRHEHTWQHFAD
jgi:UDP-N-acetyl-D-mannosaminuronic acid transferase (WecB/TagA/CpsF family)